MHVDENGRNFIKKHEGCVLKAYKAIPSEKYYTIGYGHYGSDVKKDTKITKEEAEALLKEDVDRVEKSLNKYKYDFNQNQYNALASFTFNCGAANLKKLTDNGKRTLAQISARIPNYCTAGGVILEGLKKRRAAEKALFDTKVASVNKPVIEEDYNMPEIKRGSKGQVVRVWQAILGFTKTDIDGSFGPKTESSTKALQKQLGLSQTGIVDKATWKAGLESVQLR